MRFLCFEGTLAGRIMADQRHPVLNPQGLQAVVGSLRHDRAGLVIGVRDIGDQPERLSDLFEHHGFVMPYRQGGGETDRGA